MRILLDKSPTQIHNARTKYDMDFGQLRTPLTKYRRDGLNIIHYGLDNGAYSNFNEEGFLNMARSAMTDDLCDWVVMPDIVGDAQSTTDRFHQYRDHFWNMGLLNLSEVKLAYVIQNGVTEDMIPWDAINCVFVGGDNVFKDGHQARNICETAKEKGKVVHVGRVNGPLRFASWFELADSCDGSGLAKYTHSLERLVRVIRSYETTTQTKIEGWF